MIAGLERINIRRAAYNIDIALHQHATTCIPKQLDSKPELVQIENAQFISICGKGDPSDNTITELTDKELVLGSDSAILFLKGVK